VAQLGHSGGAKWCEVMWWALGLGEEEERDGNDEDGGGVDDGDDKGEVDEDGEVMGVMVVVCRAGARGFFFQELKWEDDGEQCNWNNFFWIRFWILGV